MFQLEHRVRVFVFQVLDHAVEYLLLRQKPRSEWPLGPIVGPVAPGEKFHDAVLRQGSIPIEIIRAALGEAPLSSSLTTSWRF